LLLFLGVHPAVLCGSLAIAPHILVQAAIVLHNVLEALSYEFKYDTALAQVIQGAQAAWAVQSLNLFLVFQISRVELSNHNEKKSLVLKG
jgi:hypothetical protein